MIIFYSGAGDKSNPEMVLGDDACLMLTFIDCKNGKPTPRNTQLQEARQGVPVFMHARVPKKFRGKTQKKDKK